MPERRKQLLPRADLRAIYDIIPPGSKMLDLGCGDGVLLQLLRQEKNVFGCGVEISQDKILNCVNAGVPVVQGDLDKGLREFPDNSFNYVVLSQTLQAVRRPDLLLGEMSRVGENIVVSLINFGHISSRFQLMFKGRMPVTDSLPTPWYETLNIHLGTIDDFKDLCREKNLDIAREIPVAASFASLASLWPNMFAPTCVFLLKKSSSKK